MKAKRISTLVVLIAFFIVALHASCAFGADGASDPNPRRSSPVAGAMPEGAGLGPGGGRFGPGYQRLLSVLTDEQKASLREAMDQQRESAGELEDRFRAATRDLYATGLARNFNEDAVREKALAAAKAEAELSVLRFKAFSKMRPQLTSEQITKLREQMPERRGRPLLNEKAPESGSIQGELPRKLPARQRDENGLPIINPKGN